ncbi:hypothetical protein TraAM80_00290 [Trypanosoma rangeli]|uniref:Uncharacterized protein n=1 Tax=Trypanosoma rangeli TaxID=5698 RepID=A0A422P404_TRYRA|nr:uncharacterized protein TraAM80_00290 [Trypanosoma rangeli]RNF12438.1 hypothetical protein TraAM80_00290 [Trypanosoma rangeli]|eukprot:RNF12438.1 hypothetical protein TraAM80_00290 [Trypanosoma rangeli]
MSDQRQQQRPAAATIATTIMAAASRAEAAAEDNFAAMRHAAMSMFKQRTKDLTMVSALTAEAEEVEKLNCKVQTTISRLQEQKAVLEARIETEEHRVKEREEQLREIHVMLAQMKEDQGIFAGVRRSSEKIAATLYEFVTQYTAKSGDVVRLLERCHEQTQGRAPNEWRTATNDLRRRQSVLDERIKHIEKQHVIPVGFEDMLLEWSRGVWRQQPECATALHLCEQLLRHDASGAVRALLIPPPVYGVTNVEEEEEVCEVYASACMDELDACVSLGETIEGEGEKVGLCCAIVPHEQVDMMRSRWFTVCRTHVSLREAAAASRNLSASLEEQLALVQLLSERVGVLDARIVDAHTNLQQESIAVQRETSMHESLLSAWQKSLQTALVHMQCEATYRSSVETKDGEVARQEVELAAKTAEMEAQWTTLHTQATQMYTALLVEEQQKAEALCRLKMATDTQTEQEARLDALRELCLRAEADLRQECDEVDRCALSMANNTSQGMPLEPSALSIGKDDIEDAKEADTRACAVNDLLRQLLQCQPQKKRKAEEHDGGLPEDVAFTSLMTSTGLEADLLRRAINSLADLQQEVDHELAAHLRWKQETDDELLTLAAE